MFTLTPARRAVLSAIADTFVPAVNELPAGSSILDFEQATQAIRAQPLGAQAEFEQLARPARQATAGPDVVGAAAALCPVGARPARGTATELGGLAGTAAAQGISDAAQAVHFLLLRRQSGRW